LNSTKAGRIRLIEIHMTYLKHWWTALLLLQFSGGLCSARMELPAPPPPPTGDYVVLLHGLGRSASSMKNMERALKQEGYRVVNVSYPSTSQTIEDSAAISLAGILKEHIQDPAAKVHFVTHSLGGIVLREYLAHHQVAHLGRVVMLAPPNQGSELVDHMKNGWLYRYFTGPAGQELGTDPESLPNRLGPANFELGIIAGDCSVNPFNSARLPGPDDGKVSVARTHLDGMSDFLVVHYSHTWLAARREVIQATIRFLARNHFAATP
jgi:triacylglycerol lipase